MFGYESFDRAALPHRSWSIRPKTISARDSSAQIICFLLGFLGPGLHSLAIILILTLALVSKSKGMSASTTIKRVLHSNGLQGSIKLERNARKYHNQTNCKEV